MTGGDQSALLGMLAEDAVLIADAGPHVRRFGRIRNLGRPVVGRQKIAELIKAFWRQDEAARLVFTERSLNGQPALVVFLDGHPLSAMLVSVAGGKIRHLFFQGNPDRLRHIGAPN
jgi:RNA polymerase sigma-70 factor (ECF subfamily)